MSNADVHGEVREGHHAGEHERGGPRVEADGDQDDADLPVEIDPPGTLDLRAAGVGSVVSCTGIALAGKQLERLPYRVRVLCGDSELAEGSIWEALDKASYYRLVNLVAIVDVNRLGQRGPTELGWNLDAYARPAEAFGARVLVVDARVSGPVLRDVHRRTEISRR